MWYKCLHNYFLIKELYENVPELKDVEITSVEFQLNDDRVYLHVELPRFADYLPSDDSVKWRGVFPKEQRERGDILNVELDFFGVLFFNFKYMDILHKSTIEMSFCEPVWTDGSACPDPSGAKNEAVLVKIRGSVECDLIANAGGVIQHFTTYGKCEEGEE